MTSRQRILPLDHLRVLEMGTTGPACIAAGILGDLGADVVRIDVPAPPRPQMQRPVRSFDDIDAAFQAQNRNKRSIALNLKHEEGRKIFQKLAVTADVLIEANRPGVMERLGVGYAAVLQLNPRIVYCSVTTWGQGGPYRTLPAHEVNVQAVGGMLYLANVGLTLVGSKRQDEPQVLGQMLPDSRMITHALAGILAAIIAREKTGRGQHVDVACLDGAVPLFTGEADTSVAEDPVRAIYKTSDGRYIAIGIIETWTWINLCHALGRDDLIEMRRDPTNREFLRNELASVFLTRTRDAWFDHLRAADVQVSPVNSPEEAREDPQVLARELIVDAAGPAGIPMKQPGVSIKLSDTPAAIRSAAPYVGQHTDEILSACGYGAGDITRLRERLTVA
jgi:crotonobetainyl-CoA:carnitine CoA-transferase CaiB-like acyl-CoA transferase